MKTKLFIITIVLSCFAFSCSSDEKTEKTYPELSYLLITPDSLLSDEDFKLKIDLGDLIINKSRVENNKIVIDITKQEMIDMGFSGDYYEAMMEDIDSFNKVTDSLNINVAEMLHESKENFIEYKNESKRNN